MDNKMMEVAKLLGLELGEIFQVGNDESLKNYYFRFTKIGLEFSKSEDDDIWITADSYKVFSLLRGELSIIKLPWMPLMEEVYYVPRIYYDDSGMYSKCCCRGNNADNEFYQLGIIFRTPEGAIAMTKKMLAVAKEKALVQEVKKNG